MNNWNLVDLSSPHILGRFLFENEIDIIKKHSKYIDFEPKLAKNTLYIKNNFNYSDINVDIYNFLLQLILSDDLWYKRIAVLASFPFIKQDVFDYTLK